MQEKSNFTLILASGSPRRKELLGWLDIPFVQIVSDCDEKSEFKDPIAICRDVCRQKAFSVLEKVKKTDGFLHSYFPFIISSDTIVTLDGKIFGKPRDVEEAEQMLKALSGKTHTVITSVCFVSIDGKKVVKEHSFHVESKVTFDEISDDVLKLYLKTGESLDKAGAYGIQGKGLTFISKVEGSYSNVVGFPLSDCIKELKTFLGFPEDNAGLWREVFRA